MDDVVVTELKLLHNDDRGRTFDFHIKQSADFLLLRRRAGTHTRSVFHTGNTPATNPKTFILMTGVLELFYRNTKGNDIVSKLTLHKPAVIEVQPYVAHAIKFVSDVVMLEANTEADLDAGVVEQLFNPDE